MESGHVFDNVNPDGFTPILIRTLKQRQEKSRLIRQSGFHKEPPDAIHAYTDQYYLMRRNTGFQ